MDEYNFDFEIDRARFQKLAAELTGLKEDSIRAMARVERNRTPSGKFAPGFRYAVTSKRNGVKVTALRMRKR